ncbi:hypothetical protein N0V95_000642 [Ascochyta clinopodiicola]|nr:hypothetical protein N0V95_000642 [Ascochyta clinopodiicola]
MGAMVGAGDLNNQFRTLVKGILRKETYLEQSGDTIDTIIAAELMSKFENDIKRTFHATGVATGAILRAINKSNGPSRIPCQSIGVLRHIPCDPENEPYTSEVLKQPKKWVDQEDLDYIMDTIRWIIKKDDTMLESVHTVTFESEHLFDPDQKKWIIEEQLWASETCTLDFYKLDHLNNAGKTMEIGAVEFDIGKMRQKIRAANIREDEMVDQVVILVEMTVIDRNLEFTARWPAAPESQIIQGSRKFFSVASAFTPGTK